MTGQAHHKWEYTIPDGKGGTITSEAWSGSTSKEEMVATIATGAGVPADKVKVRRLS